MHSHIAIELLKTLNDEELKLFSDFVRSPFFNKREVVIRLFDLLSKHAPGYSGAAVKKENLYKKLFPGKEFNEQTLRSRMSELSALIKVFFIQMNFNDDVFYQKRRYINELIKRKKFDLAEKSISDAEEYLEQNAKYGQDFFLNRERNVSDYYSLMNAKDMKSKVLEAAYKGSELTIHNFLLEILTLNNELICHEMETKAKHEFSYIRAFFEKFDFEGYIKILKEKNYEHFPILGAYYYGNITMQHPDSEHYFFELKDLVYKHYEKYNEMDLYNFWSLLSNGVFANYLKHGKRYMIEGHEINKFFISNKLYKEDKPFSPLGFQNIATNAIMAGELDWCEKYLEDFKGKFTPDVIENRYYFSKALLFFERKKYNEAVECLSRVKYTDWHMKLNVRLNYLKNYYELGLSESLNSMIDSFKHFNSKNNDIIPGYIDDKIQKTINYIVKMSKIKFSGKKLDYADFKSAEKAEDYLHKEWVVEKMKELL